MEDADELERLILEFPYTEHLDELFHPLSLSDNRMRELTREKQETGIERNMLAGLEYTLSE